MAISTMDQLVAGLAAGQQKRVYKVSQSAKVAGAWSSLWKTAGEPGAAATPSTGAGDVPTSATAGAIPWTDPGGSNVAYLARLQGAAAQAGVVVLADRLWQNSGLVGNVNTLQTFTGSAVTRPDGSGDNNELWIEWYTATGSSQVNITVNYKNQAGNDGTTTFAFFVSPLAAQMIPVPLAVGDTGVRSVVSVQLSASSGTAGNFGLTILRRLGEIMCPIAVSGDTLDAFALGLPVIDDGACLFLFMLVTATTTGDFKGGLTIVEG